MTKFNLDTIINKHLLNNLFEGIFIISPSKKILFMNKKAESITGHLFAKVKNRNYFDIFKHYTHNAEKHQKHLFPLDLALENKTITKGKMSIYNKDTKQIPVIVNVIPLVDENEVVKAAIEFFILDSHYKELEEANKVLENSNNLKTQYLGMAAHDLNTPLTAIQGFNSLLTNINSSNLSFNQISILNKIDNNCIKMSKIINYFLDLSKISLKQIKLNMKKITVEELLDIENFSFIDLSAKKDIDLIITIEKNIPKIKVDKDKIIQVIENLVINSIKFSNPTTSIIIEAKKVNHNLTISITDQGMGIPENHLKLIFEAFTTSTTNKEKSTGLGLVIVKKLVELHHGKVTVSSELNVGSTFTITLPLEAT